MGRYIDRMLGKTSSSSPSYNEDEFYSIPAGYEETSSRTPIDAPEGYGRVRTIKERGEDVRTNTQRTPGRYSRRVQAEQAFLASEEGKKMVEELTKKMEEEERKRIEKEAMEKLRSGEVYQSPEERMAKVEEALKTANDPRMSELGTYVKEEALRRSKDEFEANLRALGVEEEDIKTFEGMDPKYYEQVVNEVATDPLAKQAARKTYFWINKLGRMMFKEDYDVRLPFAKPGNTTEIRGVHSAILLDMYYRLVGELIPKVAVVTYANAKTLSQEAEYWKKNIAGIIKGTPKAERNLPEGSTAVKLFFDPQRLGFTAESLGGAEKIQMQELQDSGQRQLDRWDELMSQNPDHPYKNWLKASWDTSIADVLDVWALGDAANITVKSIAGGQSAMIQQNLKALGFTPGEIAELGKLSDDALRNLVKEKAAQRFDDILNMNGGGTNPRVTIIDGTPDDALRASSEIFRSMVAEGSVSMEQAVELARFLDTLNKLGYAYNSGSLQSISRIHQYMNSTATGLNTEFGNLFKSKTWTEGLFRTRPVGERVYKNKIGLSIEDITNPGAIPEGDAFNRMDEFLNAVAGNEKLQGIDWAFDPRTNTVFAKPGSKEKLSTSGAVGDAIKAAEEARANLGVGNYDEGVGAIPEIDDIETLAGGFPENLDDIERIKRETEEAVLARRREVSKLDEQVEPLSPDSPIVQTVANLNVSQQRLSDILEEVGTTATNRSLSQRVARELLNTPTEANIKPPAIRMSALDPRNGFERAMIESQDEIIARVADLARRSTDPVEFATKYGFLLDGRNKPEVEFPGRDIFAPTKNVASQIDELEEMGFIRREDIANVIRAEIPAEMIDIPPTDRFIKMAEAMDRNEDAYREYIASLSDADFIGQAIDDEAILRSMMSVADNPGPDDVLGFLQNMEPKPQMPLFALMPDGKMMLVSQDPDIMRTVANARIGGLDTIEGYVIDYKGTISKFREFMKQGGYTLRDFARNARSIEPKLTGRTIAPRSQVAAQRLREDAGLLSGRLQRIGTSDINSVIIESKYLRQDIPVDEPVLFNGMDWRDRFNAMKQEIAGLGGSSVDVYSLGPNAVVKVAKTEQGLIQLLQNYNEHAMSMGLIPRVYEAGRNYMIVDRYDALDGAALEHFQKFQDAWAAYKPEGAIDYDEIDFDTMVFEFLDEWRNSDEAMLAVTPEGKPMFNWDEFARYRPAMGDLMRESSWGRRPDGTMVIIDQGSMDVEALAKIRGAGRGTWTKWIANFNDIVRGTPAKKKFYGDYDPHTTYSFFPVPAFDNDDDGYSDDMWRSAFFTAIFGGISRGRGPKWNRRGRNKAQQLKLPQPTARLALPPPRPDVMNANPWITKTGDAFGAVLPRVKGRMSPASLKVMDSTDQIPPLGKAGYAMLSRDTAKAYGEYDMVKGVGENTLVIKNDDEFRKLTEAAGLKNYDMATSGKAETEANIKKVRDYIAKQGHDSVLILMDQNTGPTTLLQRLFEYEQFISFNGKNFEKVSGSNVQKVSIAKTTRTKKLQRQIMRVIDPPKSKIEMDEMKLLRDRLRTINKAIKEGKKMGAAEARVYITARLRNSFGVITERLVRNHELQRLRDRIIAREKDLIKIELVKYAKQVLPSRESREFLTERGKLISSIPKTETRVQLYKVLKRIDAMREQVDRKLVTQEIEKTLKRAISSPTVSADYRKMIREFMSQYNLKGQRPDTRRRIEKMKEYIERQKALGEDVFVTEGMLKELELLSRSNIRELTSNELKNILDTLLTLEKIGRTKFAKEKEAFEALKEARMASVFEDLTAIEKHVKAVQELPWQKLPMKERIKNVFRSLQNEAQLTDLSITPVDTLFDLLGGGTGKYDSNTYRILKVIPDQKFHNYMQQIKKLRNDVEAWKSEFGIDDNSANRVGVYMASRQGSTQAERDAIIERLVAGGIPEDFIRTLQLTPNEAELAIRLRQGFDSKRPVVKRIARFFNREFNEVEEYFPILADFENMSDLEMVERFGMQVPMKEARRRKIKAGMTMKRQPGAVTPMKVNALEVYIQHMDNVLYLENMAQDVKMLSDIVNDARFTEKAGDTGSLLAREYFDLLARKGGASGQQQIWLVDFLNRNVGVAILGFKLSSALIQLSALPQGAALIGKYAFSGMRQILTNREYRQFVMDNMPEIRDTVVDDLGFLARPNPTAFAKLQDYGYAMIKYLDSVTRTAVGWGGYMKKLDELGIPLDLARPNKDALEYAQRVTRLTQSSSLWKDAPLALSRGTGLFKSRSLNRAFLKFQSFVLSQWSLIRNNAWRFGLKSADLADKKAGANILFWIMMATIAEQGLRKLSREAQTLVTGVEPEEEDDGYTMPVVKEAISKVPFLPQALSTIVYDSPIFPALMGVESTLSGAGRAVTGKTGETQAKGFVDMLTGFGTIFGAPGMFQARSLMREWIEGGGGEEGGAGVGERPEGSSYPERPQRPSRPSR